MTFESILFKKSADIIKLEVPAFFIDLNLDQLVNNITVGKEYYNLKPYFYTVLNDMDEIKYRYEIMRDIEESVLLNHIKVFSEQMSVMREYVHEAEELYYNEQKNRLHLDAIEVYCDAINSLSHYLSLIDLKSEGLIAFRAYLISYAKSEIFTSLFSETKKLITKLSEIKYCVLINDLSITVLRYNSEIDYSEEVMNTFDKFKQGEVGNLNVKSSSKIRMNDVEAHILKGVTKLFPDIFGELADYCVKNSNHVDDKIAAFDKEIQFYIVYLDCISKLKHAGLKFCYPEITNKDKDIYNYEGFDLVLACEFINRHRAIVSNDFYLNNKERIIVVTGPNQGGKTTFARTFGQLHYLASIGCPVPGREGKLFHFDNLFTHFEEAENIKNLRGKLESDLVNIHDMINSATSNSIIIMNEILTSTTLQDAVYISKMVMEKIIKLDLLCVWVTFIDELASLSEINVSMTSTVSPEDSTLRTFKIIRKPADGLAYAISIAEKYRLTYDYLKERLKS